MFSIQCLFIPAALDLSHELGFEGKDFGLQISSFGIRVLGVEAEDFSYRRWRLVEIIDHDILCRVEQKSPPLVVYPRYRFPVLHRWPSGLIPEFDITSRGTGLGFGRALSVGLKHLT